MARNVEIKARLADPPAVRARAASLATAPAEFLTQIDTFFIVPRGRLKVREFGDGSGELISYNRPDEEGPKTSSYTRCSSADARLLVRTLADVLAVRGTVVKRREVFLVGRTRVHLDDVEQLGTFLELEVVLRDDEPVEQGQREARDLLRALEIQETDLISGAYIDLIERAGGLKASPASARGPDGNPTSVASLLEWLSASTAERASALDACVERIRAIDSAIHAWVQLAPQPPTGDGPLSGIPFGVKDVIETAGLATEYGSSLYMGRIGTFDAAIVRLMRDRGGVLLGKTECAAFAYYTPGPTRNPRNTQHTPGGSSSGSAAAIAAGMVPIAVGTQTRGSILRPASYCGVTGFKPTYGLLSMQGVLPFARSLDTLGFFTQTAAEMLALWDALGYQTGRDEDFTLGVPEAMPDAVEPSMAAAFRTTLSSLQARGFVMRSLDLAGLSSRLDALSNTIMSYEGARVHEQRFKEHGDRLDDLASLVRDGLKISAEQYDEARRSVERAAATLAEMFKQTPVILLPAATGPAPFGLASTGDSRMNAPWTAAGTPAISIPMPVAGGLPLGLQLIAAPGEDARLLRTAMRLERLLAV
jgi:Asp-tRNA(Asn)/Glu-tRNA(Gln) amidotransferase A subunit family amidase/adenylate cyclase class IV